MLCGLCDRGNKQKLYCTYEVLNVLYYTLSRIISRFVSILQVCSEFVRVAFCALKLLVGHQEEHPSCIK